MKFEDRVAVVIPCFRVKAQILGVMQSIPANVWRIYVVDERCPEGSVRFVEENCEDPRVHVIFHPANQGVGGAVATGYREAAEDGASVIVKIDGDGQMDPALIERFTQPILSGAADYTKGNRFYDIESLVQMPKVRLFGNSVLSFVNKVSSGYWNVMDPTNGYTAIHANVVRVLPFRKIARRYFFESDMLFRLNTVRAVVMDIPMEARYADEKSNLRVSQVAITFPRLYAEKALKRIVYNYFVREFNAGTLSLLAAFALTTAGMAYGIPHWLRSFETGMPTPSGIVMAAALPVLIGFQFLIAALNYDVSNTPRIPIHLLLSRVAPVRKPAERAAEGAEAHPSRNQ